MTAGEGRRRVAVVQSSYIPWKGYFDLVNSADLLILYDDVQYTRRDWRNRNRVKTVHGPTWLTIPVRVRGRYSQRIDATEISDSRWARRHWRTIEQSYARAPHFDRYRDSLAALYADADDRLLSAVNERFIAAICRLLGIETRLARSVDYEAAGDRTGRLLSLCRAAEASDYITGPSAKAYLDESRFAEQGIAVTYMDYRGYPEYPQRFGPFDHRVSVLDLILNTGPAARAHMKTFDESPAVQPPPVPAAAHAE